MNGIKNHLIGLFLIATFTGTLVLLEFSDTVKVYLGTAGNSAVATAATEENPGATENDGWEVDVAAGAGTDDGWSVSTPESSTLASAHEPAEGTPACCATAGEGAAPSEAKACCAAKPTEGGAAACTTPGGIFDPSKIGQFKAAGDWCTPHGVPESMCVQCNPELVAKFKAAGDWCAGHDLPESLCPLCHKELADAGIGRDWCAKHGVPMSQCAACRVASLAGKSEDNDAPILAGVIQANVEQAVQSFSLGTEPAILEYNPTQREGINPNCLKHLSKVRFSSEEIGEEIDLQSETIATRPVYKSLTCYGEVRYDEREYALLSPRSGGIVEEVFVDQGDKVKKGDKLAIVDSVEFGKAKADYLRAVASAQRWSWVEDSYSESQTSGAIAKRDVIEAQAELESANIELAIAAQTLKNFGLDDERIEKIREAKDTDTYLEVIAPFDATVVGRKAVQGENVETGQPIFEVADLSKMWLILHVFAEDLNSVALGMPVTFKPEGENAEAHKGEVTWISSNLDEKTRTASVRAELQNPDNTLRQGLFGVGAIAIHQGEQTAVVPKDAIQWDGCCNVAFVHKEDGSFEPRKVRLGDRVDDAYVVLAGLAPGESVATQGSYLLKTEILKGQIGAGCCEHH